MAESQLYRYVILNPAALRMCATKKRERGESLRERRESRAFIIELIEQEQQLQKPNRNPEDLMVETCKNHGKHPWFPQFFPSQPFGVLANSFVPPRFAKTPAANWRKEPQILGGRATVFQFSYCYTL
jgi:hypothetical protein